MNILKMLGLMMVKEHEGVEEANERQAKRIQSLEGDVRRMTAGRDDWRSAAKDWQSKSSSAAAKLSMQARVIDNLRAENGRLVSDYAVRGDILAAKSNEVRALEADLIAFTKDALAWRAKKAKDADYEKNRRVRKSKGEKR